jgi:hypothetical protein
MFLKIMPKPKRVKKNKIERINYRSNFMPCASGRLVV